MRTLLTFLTALLSLCHPDPGADSGLVDTGVTCSCPPLTTLDCQPELPNADYELWCGPCIQYIQAECPNVGVVF